MQGLILVIFSSYNLEAETKYTPTKLADDTEAGQSWAATQKHLGRLGEQADRKVTTPNKDKP